MPQMAPMWWEILYMMFLILFLFMISFIYHYKIKYYITKSETGYNKNQMNWKW
nr:ATP synthase F0 subunit 8 [Eumenotes sp. HEM140]